MLLTQVPIVQQFTGSDLRSRWVRIAGAGAAMIVLGSIGQSYEPRVAGSAEGGGAPFSVWGGPSWPVSFYLLHAAKGAVKVGKRDLTPRAASPMRNAWILLVVTWVIHSLADLVPRHPSGQRPGRRPAGHPHPRRRGPEDRLRHPPEPGRADAIGGGAIADGVRWRTGPRRLTVHGPGEEAVMSDATTEARRRDHGAAGGGRGPRCEPARRPGGGLALAPGRGATVPWAERAAMATCRAPRRAASPIPHDPQARDAVHRSGPAVRSQVGAGRAIRPREGSDAPRHRRPPAPSSAAAAWAEWARPRVCARGCGVRLIDRGPRSGGRAQVCERGGVRHDAGPTILTAPHPPQDLFAPFGERPEDHVTPVRPGPWHRVASTDGETPDDGPTLDRTPDAIARLSPGDVDGFRRMPGHSRAIHDIAFAKLAHAPLSMARRTPDLSRRRGYEALRRMVSRHLKDDRPRRAVSIQPLPIGGDPHRTTGIHGMITHLETAHGIWFAMTGTGAPARPTEEEGVEIETGTTIDRIPLDDGRAAGVEIEGGRRLLDEVLREGRLGDDVSPDRHRSEPRAGWVRQLLRAVPRAQSARRLARVGMALGTRAMDDPVRRDGAWAGSASISSAARSAPIGRSSTPIAAARCISARRARIDFTYVLPFAPDHALIEATALGPAPPDRADLDAWLAHGIEARTGGAGIEGARDEAGLVPTVPMGRTARSLGPHRAHAGIAGGAARPPTGHAFRRIDARTAHLADRQPRGDPDLVPRADAPITRFMDRLLRRVLRRAPRNGPALLLALFQGAPTDRLERVLSGSTAPLDRASVIAAMPPRPFLREVAGR